MDEKPEFYPDIDEINADNYDGQPITLENLDYLIYKIVARTGLTYDQVSIIVKIYFNEIRTQVLNGKSVQLGDVGKLFIKLQKNKRIKDKYALHLKFKASKQIIKKAKYYAILGK